MTRSATRLMVAAATVALVATGCGSAADDEASADPPEAVANPAATSEPGIRLVSAEEGAALQRDAPDDLVILDVRTPEEFAGGHLEGAVLIDFYSDDFAEQLADLDPSVPYLVYCRSGNRSGQATATMEGLGFSDVSDIDGGILAWDEAGLPTVP